MNKQGSAGSTSTNTVRLHRVLAAKPDKVYRAFTSADALARWLEGVSPSRGEICERHSVGAAYFAVHLVHRAGESVGRPPTR